MSNKLGNVLPSEDAALLTDAAKNLTKEELTHIMSKRGSDHHSLSSDDIKSLTKVAVKRINAGQTMFGYDNMRLAVSEDEEGVPSSNW